VKPPYELNIPHYHSGGFGVITLANCRQMRHTCDDTSLTIYMLHIWHSEPRIAALLVCKLIFRYLLTKTQTIPICVNDQQVPTNKTSASLRVNQSIKVA